LGPSIGQFVIRVFVTYLLSLVVVAILLALIDKTPWSVDNALAIKRQTRLIGRLVHTIAKLKLRMQEHITPKG